MDVPQSRVVNFLVAWRYWLLALAAVLAAACWFPAGRLAFDRSIENMFAPEDPLLGPYRRLKEVFGGNEIVLAAYRDDDLLNADGSGIRRLREVSQELAAVPGVEAVMSLAQLNDALHVSLAAEAFATKRRFVGREPLVDPEIASAKRHLELFAGYTHSANGRIAAVACQLAPVAALRSASGEANPGDDSRRATIDALRRVIAKQPDGTIAGEPSMVVDGFRFVEADGVRLGWASTLLMSLVIVACFRSVRWLVIPLAIVQFAQLLTQGTLVLLGLRLSMVSSMLTAIVTVVGIATVVHFIVRYRDARFRGHEPIEAFRLAGALLAMPIVWACVTDAVGFASLTISEVGPVRHFGVMMAIGSLMVLVSVALLLPGLTLLGNFDRDPKQVWGERALVHQLSRSIGFIERYPRWVAGAVLLMLAACAAGFYRLEIETDFTKNFRRDSTIAASYDFIETNLGGAGVWDVIVPAPDVLTEEYLERVRALEERLRAIGHSSRLAPRVVAAKENGDEALEDLQDEEALPLANVDADAATTRGASRLHLTKVISLADADEVTRQLPGGSFASPELRVRAMRQSMPTFVDALIGYDETESEQTGRQRYLRIMLRAHERQSAEQKHALIREVERICREEFPPGGEEPAAEATGFFVLLAHLISSVSRDQWTTFGLAVLGVGLMMILATRSVRLAAVALVPNALPILMVMGLMGWLGMKINMGAAMIAAVSMGLSVDSSIHYLAEFRRRRKAGLAVREALAAVQETVGRAMVFATLALVIGFGALCLSEFVPTIYFGVLVGLSMLGGLMGNLVVLPLLLRWVTK